MRKGQYSDAVRRLLGDADRTGDPEEASRALISRIAGLPDRDRSGIIEEGLDAVLDVDDEARRFALLVAVSRADPDAVSRTERLARMIPSAPASARLSVFRAAFEAASGIDDAERRRVERIEIANRVSLLPESDRSEAVRATLGVTEDEPDAHVAGLLGRVVDHAGGAELDALARMALEMEPSAWRTGLLVALVRVVDDERRTTLVEAAVDAIRADPAAGAFGGGLRDGLRGDLLLALLPHTRGAERKFVFDEARRAIDLGWLGGGTHSYHGRASALAELARFSPPSQQAEVIREALVATQALPFGADPAPLAGALRERLAALSSGARARVLHDVLAAVAEIRNAAAHDAAVQVLSAIDSTLEMPPFRQQASTPAREPNEDAPVRTLDELAERLAATQSERVKARTAVDAARAKLRRLREQNASTS